MSDPMSRKFRCGSAVLQPACWLHERRSRGLKHHATELVRCVGGLAILTAILPPLHAGQTVDMETGASAEIEFIEHLESAPPSGWIPVAFRITNRAPNDREWRATFEADVGSGVDHLGNWTLRVAGGETREVNLFVPQPWFAANGSYFNIRGYVAGPGVRNGSIYVNRQYRGGDPTWFAGMSHLLAAENWSRLESELDPSKGTSSGMSSSGSSSELSGSRFDPAQMPADWRAWSGFATVWIARDDWIALKGTQRLALFRWVAQGGDLYVAGSGSGLDDLPPASRDNGDTVGGGDMAWPLAPYGLGQIHRVPIEPDNDLGPRLPIERVAATIRASEFTAPALAQQDNEIDLSEAETSLGTIRPGGPMLGLLIAAIAILLGPVNIFLLAPARRRARLFITVPVISLGGAAALVALILFQDGTGGNGKRGVLIALLPDRPEALILQEQCVMTGLLFNRDFAMPEDATFVDYSENIADRSYHAPSIRSPRTGLDRAGDQMTGDWFTSRSVQSHHVRAFVPLRAALTLIHSADDAPTVVSTCPGVLRDLRLTDKKGNVWSADEVPPGQSVTLKPATGLITDRWAEQLRRFGVSLARSADQGFVPMSFRASADSWDENVPLPTLPSIRWRDDTILVTGQVREGKL
jgi:hypothetical protein